MLKLLNTKLLLAILATLAVLASAAIYQRHEVAKATAILVHQQRDAELRRKEDAAFRKKVEEDKRKHNSAAGNEGKTWNTYNPVIDEGEIDMNAVIVLAQALPSASSGMDWLYQFTNNLTNLTTQNGGALTQLGLTELSAIALFTLISMVINWNTSSMTFRLHHHPVQAGDLTNFLMKLIVCCLLENYWVNPFPGASLGINHFFSYIAQAMVTAFDQHSLDQLLQLLKTAGDGTAMPSFTAPVEILCYVLVKIMLGMASAILFVINCSAFILYGVMALFGPVFIPLLMTQSFKAKFFHFLDVLISFAMIRAVAAAFIYVWAGFMNGYCNRPSTATTQWRCGLRILSLA